MPGAYQQLTHCVIEFVGLLRKAGIKTGSDGIIKSTQAISMVSIGSHQDLYLALRSCLIYDHQQQEIFDQLFALYWGHARLPDSALSISLPRSKIQSPGEKSFANRTLDAFEKARRKVDEQNTEVELLQLSWSDQQRLSTMDFESMSAAEYIQAEKLLNKIRFLFSPDLSRRYQITAQYKKIDFKNTLRASSKYHGELIELKYKKPKYYFPSIVLLIDISGSMSRYAQIMLRFSHLLSRSRANVHVFLFATQLSPVSIELTRREIDDSHQVIGQRVTDWNSGTRIGSCLNTFNNNHLRRIVNSKSEVLIVTDGLDRGDGELLGRQLNRLHRSCKRLIWLNPLLRFKDYQPSARGANTLHKHVDELLSIHNLESLIQLVEFLFKKRQTLHNRVA